MIKKFLDSITEGIDEPLPTESVSFLKKNKLRVLMIFEDLSYAEYFVKFPKSYIFDIKDKSYFVVPKCIIRGHYPVLLYFYNNPFPLDIKFSQSKLKSTQLYSKDNLKELDPKDMALIDDTYIDAEAIKLAFNSVILKGLYGGSGITIRNLIIILVIVFIIILVVLQVTGVVDVWGAITGMAKSGA